MNNVYAALLAGGQGSRMGGDMPKQFQEIDGIPILIRTLIPFLTCEAFEDILIVSPKEWIDHTFVCLQQASEIYKIENRGKVRVVEGGSSRSESLMNAIRYLEEGGLVQDDTILVSHDAVRPFIDHRILLENIEKARQTGACATLIPATDTIAVSSDGEWLDHVPDRKEMFHMQTPQSFRIREYVKLYEALDPEQKESLTDASRVFLLNHHPVAMVEGRRENIKITYPEDLEYAGKILL